MVRGCSIATLALGLVLTGLIGCGPDRLKSDHTFTVPGDEGIGKVLRVESQSVEQTVRVEVVSDKPVDVYVLLAKEMPASEADATPREIQAKAIVQKQAVTQEVLTAKIPAKNEWRVVVFAGAKTAKATGTIKLSN